jgi:hypothetical protein
VALTVAITVRMQAQGFDLPGLLWIGGALFLIWIASLLLTLLQAEEEI